MARLLVTLMGEEDEVAFHRGVLTLDHRHLRLVRNHFGEEALVARNGECFATVRITALDERGGRLGVEVTPSSEFGTRVPVPFGASIVLDEVDERDFEDIVGRGEAIPAGFAEAPRMLTGIPDKTDAEIDVLAAYEWRCALTGFAAKSPAEARGRLDVVWLQPLDLGGSAHVTNGVSVDVALAYALRNGHLVISDDCDIEVRVPLPAIPLTPLLPRLLLPGRPDQRPSPASIRFHRDRAAS